MQIAANIMAGTEASGGEGAAGVQQAVSLCSNRLCLTCVWDLEG